MVNIAAELGIRFNNTLSCPREPFFSPGVSGGGGGVEPNVKNIGDPGAGSGRRGGGAGRRRVGGGEGEKRPDNPLDAMKKAILENDIAGMQASLNSLNTILTGKNEGDFQQNAASINNLRMKLKIFTEESREFPEGEAAELVVNLGDLVRSQLVVSRSGDIVNVSASEHSSEEIVSKLKKIENQPEPEGQDIQGLNIRENDLRQGALPIDDLASGKRDIRFGVRKSDIKPLIIYPNPPFIDSYIYFSQPGSQPISALQIPTKKRIEEIAKASRNPVQKYRSWVIFNTDLARQKAQEGISLQVIGDAFTAQIRSREEVLFGSSLESPVMDVEHGIIASSIYYANSIEAQKALQELNQLFQDTKTSLKLVSHSQFPQETQSKYIIARPMSLLHGGERRGQPANVEFELTVSKILSQDREPSYQLTFPLSPSSIGGVILDHLKDTTEGILIPDQEAVHVGLKPISQVEGTTEKPDVREYVYIDPEKFTKTVNKAIAEAIFPVQTPETTQTQVGQGFLDLSSLIENPEIQSPTLNPVELRGHLLGNVQGPYTVEINAADSGQTKPVKLTVEMAGISPVRHTSQVGNLIGLPVIRKGSTLVDVPYVRFLFSPDNPNPASKERMHRIASAVASAFEKKRVTSM